MKPQVPKGYYNFRSYVHNDVWMNYWYQINETLKFGPKSVLLIGKGDGLVADVLGRENIKVTTFDFDKNLEPDIVGDIREIDTSRKFDLILCCEVLEHLPFDDFERCLIRLKKISDNLIISLPYFNLSAKFLMFVNIRLPHWFFVHGLRFALRMPFPKKHNFKGEHYWEIGKRGYSSTKIKRIIGRHFKIKKSFVPWESQQHYFFILKANE